jgi:hypothetical protein
MLKGFALCEFYVTRVFAEEQTTGGTRTGKNRSKKVDSKRSTGRKLTWDTPFAVACFSHNFICFRITHRENSIFSSEMTPFRPQKP